MRTCLQLLAFCVLGAVPVLATSAAVKAHVTIFMTQDAQLVVNGKPADIDATKAALEDLKSKDGVVWYSREHPDQAMSEKQQHLFVKLAKMISDLGLPIKLFTDGTFKKEVDDSGNPGYQ